MKIYYIKRCIGPFRGMCVPPLGIFICEQHRNDKSILDHELIHWQQYKRMGFVMYYLRYFLQLVLIGYDTMPMEMEARAGLSENEKWNYRKIFHNQ